MPIIAKTKRSGAHVIVLGSGYGAFATERASRLLGDLFPSGKEGTFEMVAVSDANGEILWIPADELEIIEVDGQPPANILANYPEGDATYSPTTEEEVKAHPNYRDFIIENSERLSLSNETLVHHFQQWLQR